MIIDSETYYIVRADRAGVFFGKITEKSPTSVTMTDVRKIHYWNGACAVEEISRSGVADSSRLTVTISEMEIASPIQILPCTPAATNNLKGKLEWKQK